jgi:hypothetical protein
MNTSRGRNSMIETELQLKEVYIEVFDNANAYTDYSHHELIEEIRFQAQLLREYRESDNEL